MYRENREYRMLPAFEARAMEGGEKAYLVEGYASTFDKYMLYEWDGVEYFEQFDRNAFDEADFSDCCFLKDHTGTVFARYKNGTVEIETDDHGLKVRADLSKTEAAREHFGEIEAGMYDQMSFAFTIREDSYDRETHTRTILKVDKVYDVSSVAWPANPNTDISAATRARFDGFIESEKAERLEAEQRLKALELKRRKLALKIKVGGK